jgi:hypothetical protein
MTKQPYQRQPGDLEIRVLKDGRFVLVAPDQELMDLGKTITESPSEETCDERKPHASTQQENTKPCDSSQ